MTLYITYCSRDKKEADGLLPAIERYHSQRIEQVHELGREAGAEFAILSGKFGIVEPRDKIPYYDEILSEDRVESIARKAENYLARNNVSEAKYFTRPINEEREPYLNCIRSACEAAEVDLTVEILEA